MVWIYAGNNTTPTGMIWLLLSRLLTGSRPFLPFTSPHQQVGCGWTWSWERTQPRHLTHTDTRDLPHHMASCLAYKPVAEGGRVGCFVFPRDHCMCEADEALLPCRWLNICLWWVTRIFEPSSSMEFKITMFLVHIHCLCYSICNKTSTLIHSVVEQ